MKKREEMKKLREEGLTYQEIANRMGCTRQNVYQAIGERDEIRFQTFDRDRCVFEGLRMWLNAEKVSVSELNRRMLFELGDMRHPIRLAKCLRGLTEFKKEELDAILHITGLSYEVCF